MIYAITIAIGLSCISAVIVHILAKRFGIFMRSNTKLYIQIGLMFLLTILEFICIYTNDKIISYLMTFVSIILIELVFIPTRKDKKDES